MSPRPPTLILALAAAGMCWLAVACGGSGNQGIIEDPSPALLPSPAGTRAAGTNQPGPTATAELATPSSTGPARIAATVSGACRLSDNGSEISISYRVIAEGSAQLSRVRFLVDGRLTEETGPTTERDLRRNATIKVADGTTHVFQVSAEAGSSIRSTASTTVSCIAPTKGPTL